MLHTVSELDIVCQARFTGNNLPFARMKLANRLKSSREAVNMNQTELANAAGVSRNAISLIESGTTKAIKSAHLFRLARQLGVRAEWLANGEGARASSELAPRHRSLISAYRSLPKNMRTEIRSLIESAYATINDASSAHERRVAQITELYRVKKEEK